MQKNYNNLPGTGVYNIIIKQSQFSKITRMLFNHVTKKNYTNLRTNRKLRIKNVAFAARIAIGKKLHLKRSDLHLKDV